MLQFLKEALAKIFAIESKTIFALAALSLILYLVAAWQRYRALAKAVVVMYGEKNLDSRYPHLILRALLWPVPPRIYHWRNTLWMIRRYSLIYRHNKYLKERAHHRE